MAKTPFFRVAVEGATATDGRTITREMIEQSATAYHPTTYTARINCEHLRGFSPEPPFNAYGSVLALKAEDFELQIDGKPQTRRALYAQLDANDQMVATVKADQKIFTSCEFAPNFAKTGKFGLVGLAITDNPASLGTEALSFSAFKPMWDARKSDAANLFSAAEENIFSLEAPAVAQPDASAGAFASMKAFFDRFSAPLAPVAPMAPVTPTQPAAPAAPTPPIVPANDNFAAISEGLGLIHASLTALSTKVDTDVGSLRNEFGTLKTRLESTPQSGFSRPPASGGTGAIVTDC